MVRRTSPNPPFTEQQQQQHQQLQDPIPFYDFDSCFADSFPDFDPIKEWLIDPDQNPMADSDIITGHLDAFGSGDVEIAHQDSILEVSLGDKMEKVSLAGPEMEPEGAGGGNREVVLEAKVAAGDGASDEIIAEPKKGEIGEAMNKSTDAVSGVFSVEDPVKALNAGDGEEISDESEEESEDSSSESSSSSSSSEEEESSSGAEEEENGNGDDEDVKEWLIDPDQNLMADSDIITGHLDGFGSENVETAHQDSILEEVSLGDKMEKVSLAGSEMEPEGAGGGNREVLEKKVEVDDGISDGIIAETKKGEISEATNNSTVAVSGVFSVEDPVKALNAGDGEEISDESEEESEDSSSESSSSSSSSEEEESSSGAEEEENGNSDDEDVKEATAAVEVEVEEGEIKADDLDELILGSDGEEEVAKGPIKSKHEIEDLPPVPPLEVSLKPHHQTLPVGFVSSILGNRVIVEGSEKHSPLNEGSILWMTETKFPLGIVDEIFGPVKNPYYIVRYNSDKEIPPGTCIGVAVSFVADFANHILNEKSLYQKGYDASGMDDEEVMDEVEFSDDEKEAEYRRSLRQNKRDASHGNQESGFSKKNSFKGAGSHRDKQVRPPHSLPGRPMDQSRPPNCNTAHEPANLDAVAPLPSAAPAFPSQPQAFSMGVSSALGNTVQRFNSGPMQGFLAQPQPIGMQGGTFRPQPQLMGIQGGFPPPPQAMMMQGGGPPLNWFPGQQFGDQTRNLQHQAQVLNNFASGVMPYQQQQFLPYVGAIPGNFPWVAGLANPSINPSSALAGLMGQGGFGQVMFGCGNMNPQPQGSSCVSNGQAPPAASQGKMRPSSMQSNRGQPNGGRSSSRGRTHYQRGRHHSFGRGRGNQHNA